MLTKNYSLYRTMAMTLLTLKGLMMMFPWFSCTQMVFTSNKT